MRKQIRDNLGGLGSMSGTLQCTLQGVRCLNELQLHWNFKHNNALPNGGDERVKMIYTAKQFTDWATPQPIGFEVVQETGSDLRQISSMPDRLREPDLQLVLRKRGVGYP